MILVLLNVKWLLNTNIRSISSIWRVITFVSMGHLVWSTIDQPPFPTFLSNTLLRNTHFFPPPFHFLGWHIICCSMSEKNVNGTIYQKYFFLKIILIQRQPPLEYALFSLLVFLDINVKNEKIFSCPSIIHCCLM